MASESPFQTRVAEAFPPEPSSRAMRDSPPVAWVVSPVATGGRSKAILYRARLRGKSCGLPFYSLRACNFSAVRGYLLRQFKFLRRSERLCNRAGRMCARTKGNHGYERCTENRRARSEAGRAVVAYGFADRIVFGIGGGWGAVSAACALAAGGVAGASARGAALPFADCDGMGTLHLSCGGPDSTGPGRR